MTFWCTEASARRQAIGRHVHNVLGNDVLEQHPVGRSIQSGAATVQAARTGLAAKDPAHEAQLRILAEQLDDLREQALVHEVAVLELQRAHGLDVILALHPLLELLDAFQQSLDSRLARHGTSPAGSFSGPWQRAACRPDRP